jgi:hypothetical protein
MRLSTLARRSEASGGHDSVGKALIVAVTAARDPPYAGIAVDLKLDACVASGVRARICAAWSSSFWCTRIIILR